MDPYQVLGVDRNADEDTIKKAYRTLSRKYHPDANINNPNKAAAEEKFKQVQQAYDLIMKERERGYSSAYGYSSGPRGAAQTNQLRAAQNYISNGYYKEAMNVLLNIPAENRRGEWYYLAAVASEGMLNLSDARNYVARALSFEPNNLRYRQLMQHLDGSGSYSDTTYQNPFGSTGGWYKVKRSGYEQPYDNGGSWCLNMILLNLFCNCCCI